MGSKKWTSVGSVIGTLAGGIGVGTLIGGGVGAAVDHNQKKKSSGGAVAGATETEEEKNNREKSAGEGGESPFENGALGVTTKKKKLNTLVGGYSNGALSGSGEGSTTLG